MCLLLKHVISSKKVKLFLPEKTPWYPNSGSANAPLLLLPVSGSVVPEESLDCSETEIDSSKLQTNQDKSQTPPAADGLVLRFLFIFSAHQETLADLQGGWPILLCFRKCPVGRVAFTGSEMSHLLSQLSKGRSIRRVLSVQLTQRALSVLKTQSSATW